MDAITFALCSRRVWKHAVDVRSEMADKHAICGVHVWELGFADSAVSAAGSIPSSAYLKLTAAFWHAQD